MNTRNISALLLVFGLLAAPPAFAQKTTKKKTARGDAARKAVNGASESGKRGKRWGQMRKNQKKSST